MIAALLFSLVAADAAPAIEPVAERLAVLPLRADGVQQNEAARLAALLRLRAHGHGKTVQDEQMTTELVESSQSLGLKCDVNDARCAAEIGAVADVDVVVVGEAHGNVVAGRIGVRLLRVDVKTKAATRIVRALVPADVDAFGPAVDVVAAALFDGGDLATVDVTAGPVDAAIFVDGVASAAHVNDLVAGEHAWRVEKKGFLPQSGRFVVVDGEVVPVAVTLAEDPDAVRVESDPLVQVVPWVVAGSGGVIAIAGIATTIVGAQPWFALQGAQDDVKKLDVNDPAYPTLAASLRKESERAAADWTGWGQATHVAGWVVTGIGVLAGAGGAVAAVLLAPDPTTEN